MAKKTIEDEQPRKLSGDVLDLTIGTQRMPFDLTINKMDFGKEILEAQHSKFLKEVDLGNNIHACYFKTIEISEMDLTKVFYELAWLRIPEGFQYVYHKIENDKVVITNIDPPLTKGLLSPLLLLQNKPIAKKQFHLCLNRKPAVQHSPDGSPIPQSYDRQIDPKYGCFVQIGTIIFISKINILVAQNSLNISSSRADYKRADNPVERLRGTYFFIPLIISERVVVYCVIKTNAEGTKNVNKMTEFYQKLKAGETDIDAVSPIMYDDIMGIFITTAINMFDSPKP